MNATYFFIAILMAPVWFPPIRLVISLLGTEKRMTRAAIWCYGVAFVWAAGGVSYQWAIKIPSGIGYGLVLITAWLLMLVGIVLDLSLSQPAKNISDDQC